MYVLTLISFCKERLFLQWALLSYLSSSYTKNLAVIQEKTLFSKWSVSLWRWVGAVRGERKSLTKIQIHYRKCRFV